MPVTPSRDTPTRALHCARLDVTPHVTPACHVQAVLALLPPAIQLNLLKRDLLRALKDSDSAALETVRQKAQPIIQMVRRSP
jgi:hypothetical protein